MQLATWNVNSVRARHAVVLEWLEARRPDVLCLQETKVEDDKFPALAYRALGYDVALCGQKSYNGVAILSRAPLRDVTRGLGDAVDDPQARFLAATAAGVRVMTAYVPNGEAVGSDKFVFKLAWLERLRAHLERHLRPGAAALLCGDFNVAPAELDVWEPRVFAGKLLFTLDERAALERVKAVGLVDVVRALHPDARLYTWWDYQAGAFGRDEGLRLDHVYVTPALAARATAAEVDRAARAGKQPSDHAPVIVTFRDV